jgi:hypothetical protein
MSRQALTIKSRDLPEAWDREGRPIRIDPKVSADVRLRELVAAMDEAGMFPAGSTPAEMYGLAMSRVLDEGLEVAADAARCQVNAEAEAERAVMVAAGEQRSK